MKAWAAALYLEGMMLSSLKYCIKKLMAEWRNEPQTKEG